MHMFHSGSRMIEPLTPSKVIVSMIIKEWLQTHQVLPSARIQFNKMLLAMLQKGESESFKMLFSKDGSPSIHKRHRKWMADLGSRVETIIKNVLNDGVAALVDFHCTLGELVYGQDAAVTATSVAGLFLRRVCVQFECLSFADLAILQRRIQVFVQSHLRDLIAQKADDDRPNRSFNKDEAELYISKQVELLQQSPYYADSASSIASSLASITDLHGDALPSAHFLDYLNCLRQKNLDNAEISLKRAFGTTHNPTQKGNDADKNGNSNSNSNRDQSSASLDCRTKNLRYSLIMLTQLHTLFEDNDSALSALHEAIRLARDAADETCLQFALAWLLELQQEGDENCSALFKTLLFKSDRLNLNELAFHALKVRMIQKTTRGGDLSLLLQQLHQSSRTSLRSPELRVDHCSLASFIFSWHGFTSMSVMHSQMPLVTNFGKMNCKEAHALAMCNVANATFANGNYKGATAVFSLIKKLFPSSSSAVGRLWSQCELMVGFKHKLYTNEWPKANAMIMSLEPFNAFEAKLMGAELDLWQGNGENLSKKIEELKVLLSLKKEATKEDELRVTWMEIEWLCLLRKFNHAERVSCMAVKLSSDFRLFHYEAISQLYLAHIKMHLGRASTTLLNKVESALTQVLVSGNVFEEGRARLLMSKIVVVVTKEQDHILKAIDQLKLSINAFRRVQAHCRVKDALYLLARLFDHLGMEEDRNLASSEFRRLDEQTPMYAMPALPYML